MPHTLNIDGVTENAFDLQMLVYSSKSFCAKHQIAWGGESPGEFDWEYYFGWLKSSLCEKLIRSAITLRMLQDILAADDMQESIDLENYQDDSIAGIQLGIIHEGSFVLRCAKCATRSSTQTIPSLIGMMTTGSNGGPETYFFSGEIAGLNGNSNWTSNHLRWLPIAMLIWSRTMSTFTICINTIRSRTIACTGAAVARIMKS